MAKRKKPTDPNELAAFIVDEATSESTGTEERSDASQAASELGSLGGKKGGRARAESLTPERRREIAQEAARVRWGRSGKK